MTYSPKTASRCRSLWTRTWSRHSRRTKNVGHRCRGSNLDNAANAARVCRFQIQPGDLAAQHRDLMAKDENLDLVRAITPQRNHEQLRNKPYDVYPTDKITASSITDPAPPASHKPARQPP